MQIIGTDVVLINPINSWRPPTKNIIRGFTFSSYFCIFAIFTTNDHDFFYILKKFYIENCSSDTDQYFWKGYPMQPHIRK